MRTRHGDARHRLAAGLALALGLMGNWPAAATAQDAPAAGDPVLHIRVYADNGVDEGTTGAAKRSAQRLLDAAGLTTHWRVCDRSAACDPLPGSAPEIVVALRSHGGRNQAGHCGLAASGQQGRGTAIISVRCVTDVTFALSRGLPQRSTPALLMPGADDVIGAVVAHEIGHILGLHHAGTGLMRATIAPGDIVALRRGTLGFSRTEGARLRAAAKPTPEGSLAGKPSPPR